LDVLFHPFPSPYSGDSCISAYGSSQYQQISSCVAYILPNTLSVVDGDEWYYQIEAIKEAYAVTPSKAINIFITCQDSVRLSLSFYSLQFSSSSHVSQSNQGTLLGIGTFPWDPLATSSLGGLWLNSLATGYGLKTLTHEMGHNLGLWHTFHGVSEVTSCRSACYEYAHAFEDPAANTIGDFCSDTAGNNNIA